MVSVGRPFRALNANITFTLDNIFCTMYYSIRKCAFSISLQKIDTFRIFYAKLDIPFSVNGSIGRRNEIMFGGHYNN